MAGRAVQCRVREVLRGTGAMGCDLGTDCLGPGHSSSSLLYSAAVSRNTKIQDLGKSRNPQNAFCSL